MGAVMAHRLETELRGLLRVAGPGTALAAAREGAPTSLS